MFTTSRYASAKTRKLAARTAADADEPFVARGKHTVVQLVEIARRRGEEHISIIEESRGEPVATALIEVSETGKWRWAGKKDIKMEGMKAL